MDYQKESDARIVIDDLLKDMSKPGVREGERIESAILIVREHKVLLDVDLASLYCVETKTLNRAVKRNLERFPADFMFQLNNDEVSGLRCQFGTLKTGRGQHRKYLPCPVQDRLRHHRLEDYDEIPVPGIR